MGTMRGGGMGMGMRAERTSHGRTARAGQPETPKRKPNLKKLWPQIKALVLPRKSLLVIGLLTRPAALIAFLFLASLWVSEWGTSWIWELLVPVLASLGLALGRAGRAWGVDAVLARRHPSSPWW